jgi:thiol-disulfide isomerase/thioredoxin
MFACLLLPALMQGGDVGDVGYTAVVQQPDAQLQAGPWRAWLDSPGGELPFALVIERTGARLSAKIGNGEESIAVPDTRFADNDLVFDIPHYDSKITARVLPLGTRLEGEWKKRSGPERWTKLAFHATAGAAPRFTPLQEATPRVLEGRWSAHFDKGEEDGVLVLRKGTGDGVEGTFLLPSGDFRWLAGSVQGDRLRLSCFDGAHAFLFDATGAANGGWKGKFWSGDRWEDSWTGKLDPNAQLADGFGDVHWKEGFDLGQLAFPDLDGKKRSLADPAFAGKAIVIQILGSWCPNCHDETAYLARVYDTYKDRGLSVIGLAFEVTGDAARDSEQVRRMRERYKVGYPILLAGTNDKKKVVEVIPALDKMLAFPTTIFLDGDGRMRAVHTGFSGPGTKEEYERLKKRFEGMIEELLAEPKKR